MTADGIIAGAIAAAEASIHTRRHIAELLLIAEQAAKLGAPFDLKTAISDGREPDELRKLVLDELTGGQSFHWSFL